MTIDVDLGLSAEQEELVRSLGALLAKWSSPEQVREAEASGFDPRLWAELRDFGALAMAVPEAAGGWGAAVVDLALVAEQLGRASASAPVLEAQVAARALAAVGTPPAQAALEAALAGEQLVTVAVRPAAGGTATMVPGGAVCDAVLALDGDRLLLAPVADAARRPVANLASAPLADLDLAGGEVLATGPDAAAAFEAAVDEWLALTAAAVVGVGAAALDLGCAYACERRAFGSLIGTFQAISHRLADDATALDGARLLAWEAAWSHDVASPRRRELSAMAFGFASRAAEAATYDALHTHGGYGFMLEYDVQLHHRRARGWPRVWGSAVDAEERVADARYGRGASS